METEEAALTKFMKTVDCKEAIPYSECVQLFKDRKP